MNIIMAAALGIGLFTLAGVAMTIVIFTGLFLYYLPVNIYKARKEKKIAREKRLAALVFVEKLKKEMEESVNREKAYNDAVEKASLKVKKTPTKRKGSK